MQARVLVVEHDLLSRQTFVEMVGVCGCHAMAAEDGGQARDMLRNMHFDIALTGYFLGSSSGIQFANDVKIISPGTAVIITGGYVLNDILSRRVVDFHLPKPFSILQLRQALHSFVGRAVHHAHLLSSIRS